MAKRGPKPKPEGQNDLGRSLEEHPLFEEIEELLRHRFSPDTIIRMIEWRYGPEQLEKMPPLPSRRTLHRWRSQHMPPADLLPARLVEQKLQQLELKVDLFKSLQNVYVLAEDRVARALGTEEELVVPMPGTDKALESLLAVGELMWRVGQDIGANPRGARAPVNVFMAGRLSTDAPSEEEMLVVARALYKLQTGQEPPDFSRPVIEGEATEVTDA